MRLIDAESLSSMRFTHKMHDSEGRLYVPFDEVAEAIFNAPTIEADPVKHGRWKWNGDEYVCTVCGHHAYGNGVEIITEIWHYCPSCGAKMDKEKGEEA